MNDVSDRPKFLVAPDGQWALDELQKLSVEEWKRWMLDRLAGRDERVMYERDEFPDDSAHIFFVIYDKAIERDMTELIRNLSIAACKVVLQLSVDAADWFTFCNACDLVGYFADGIVELNGLRSLTAEKLAEWIRDEKLLSAEHYGAKDRVVHAHGVAMFTLALIQRRGDTAWIDIWRTYFDDLFRRSGFEQYEYAFIVPAFYGLSFCSETPPVDDIKKLLEYKHCATIEGKRMYIHHAIMSLFSGHPPLSVKQICMALSEAGMNANDIAKYSCFFEKSNVCDENRR